jgi:hypothetical protein
MEPEVELMGAVVEFQSDATEACPMLMRARLDSSVSATGNLALQY